MNANMAATYLLTGGAGFIGSHLSERLRESGHRVISVDNFAETYDYRVKIRNVLGEATAELPDQLGRQETLARLRDLVNDDGYRLEIADIRDRDALERIFRSETIDAVIHLGALPGVRASIERPFLFNEVNVGGTLNLLETMRGHGVRKWLCASSSSVYGNNAKVPFAETDDAISPISLYAATKKSCELLGYTYHHLYGIDGIMLRFFTVYGERQRPDLAIHKFTRLIDQGLEVPYYGDGSTRRDYTYIGDIVDGIAGALDYVQRHDSVYEILNLGGDHTVTLREMVETLERELGQTARLRVLPEQPGDVAQTCADIGKARHLIGYEPKMIFAEGIRRFVHWYRGGSAHGGTGAEAVGCRSDL